jgi:hypothetical protein
MRIGELARELGVTPHAVRFYEKAGWLPTPGRAENGYREYDRADLDHLRLLVDLRRMDCRWTARPGWRPGATRGIASRPRRRCHSSWPSDGRRWPTASPA